MLCSVLLRNGTGYLPIIEQGLRQWMEEHEYESVDQMRGSMSQLRCSDPGAFERAQYMRAVKDFAYIEKSSPPAISKVQNWGPE